MASLSLLAQKIPASPIRKLVPYAESARKRGVKVYPLNIGQPDIETPEAALSAIRTIDNKVLEYTHSAGVETYRRTLVDFYNKEKQFGIDLSDLIVTTGGSEALLFTFFALCNPGDEVIIPEPFYANYNSFAMEAGARVVAVPASIETGFALPAIEEFERRITPRTRAILICNPNNPTGRLYTEQEIEALKELVVRHDLFLIADEVYSDFCYDGAKHHSVMRLKGIENRVVVVDSVSKRYSMCGVRVGALISKNKQIIDAALRMGQARLCSPYLGQVAAAAAAEHTPKSYFEAVQREYVARRDFMIAALRQIPGVEAPMPQGAFYAMVGLPVHNSEHFAQWLLEEFSYQGATVMVAPAQGFYSDPATCPQNQVRVAYVLSIEDLRVAMDVLAQALKVYPNP